MLANEMKYDFLIGYDKISNLAAPGYDDREISFILNKAQDRVFFTKYNPLGNKYQQGFESSEKRKRDLAELVTTVNLFGADSTNNDIYTNDVTYTCIVGNDVGGLAKLVTITTINKTMPVGLPSLPLTKGLYKGMTITFNGSLTAIITDILSSTTFLVNTVATGKTSFIGGLGLSVNQFDAHGNGLGGGITPTSKGYIFDLPDLFLYTIEESVITSEEVRTYIPVLPIEHDFYIANIRNPYKTPYKNLVWRMNIGRSTKGIGKEDNTGTTSYQYAPTAKRVEIITNGSKINDYFIRYLKYPRRIICDEVTPTNQISCELDESVHNEIIDEAVKIATGITNINEYQIKNAERQNAE